VARWLHNGVRAADAARPSRTMIHPLRAFLALSLVVALGGCGPESPGAGEPGGAGGGAGAAGATGAGGGALPTPGSDAGASGGTQQGAELEVMPAMFVVEEEPLVLVAEGDDIPLTLPPQGGHVLMVGAQVRNLHTDTVELRTRLRELDTGVTVAEEGRTVVMVKVPGDDTLSQPDLRTRSQVNHVPVCPDYGDKDVVGRAYRLEVVVRELYVDVPRTATGTRTVTPSCADVADVGQCTCECSANYLLGKCKPTGG
jgi:hypothetical protein